MRLPPIAPVAFLQLALASLACAQGTAPVRTDRDTAPADAPIALPARYRDAGALRWGADSQSGAPFVFADPADPTHEVGFEVDLARELGRVLGVEMVHVEADWERLLEVLERGDCDLVLNGFEPTPSRRQLATFTRPYYVFQQQLSVRRGSEVTSLEECTGRVGCLGQSASQLVLARYPRIETVLYEDSAKAYEEVVNRRNVGALADLPIAQALSPRYPDLQAAGPPFGEFLYAMAVRRGDVGLRTALDAAIGRLAADGALERVYRKWELWTPLQERLRTWPVEADADADPAQRGAGADDSGPTAARGAFAWLPALTLMGLAALRTVGVSAAAFALAVGLGLGLAVGRLYGSKPLRWLTVCYVELFRGTPVLVQLLVLYYGLGRFEALQLPAWLAGILGLGLNYAAYEAEIYRGALSAIPRGQVEASLALGMSGRQTVRHVVLPQALRLSLPASTNDFIALFKDSSIVMVITVVELTKQYTMLASASGYHITLGLVTSAFYLAMSLPLARLALRFERSLDRDRA